MEKLNGLFTSESVSEGHPDKVCDLIADKIVDACIEQDPESHVAVEMMAGRGYFVVGGNIKTKAKFNTKEIVRETLRGIGYVSEDTGATADNCAVIDMLDKQSSDIDEGVKTSLEARTAITEDEDELQGAGDQGLMFGYASRETETYMPLAISIAHSLVEQATKLRKDGVLSWARPDMKSQVTVKYVDGNPVSIDTVVFSCQHIPEVSNEHISRDLLKYVIIPVLNHYGYDGADKYFINPSGRFVIGGPTGDCGVVGRKIIVDTYGGYCPHGGGAFSGKDPSKVDRSGAYVARYVAKNIVAAGLADKCQVQLAYAIGKAHPVSINVNTFGTGKYSNEVIEKAIAKVFKLTPRGIIKSLNLLRPIYSLTSNYGHFGRELPELTWEKCDKVVDLIEAIKEIKGE